MTANPAKQKKWLLELTIEARALYMDGHPYTWLFSHALGQAFSTGFTRIVVGDRGPYIEFSEDQVVREHLEVPADQAYRLTPRWHGRVFYEEYRTEHGVMVYKQLRTVSYADYKVGMYYVSPWDVVGVHWSASTDKGVEIKFTTTPKPESHR